MAHLCATSIWPNGEQTLRTSLADISTYSVQVMSFLKQQTQLLYAIMIHEHTQSNYTQNIYKIFRAAIM